MATFEHRVPTFQIISLKQTLEMRLQGQRQDSFKAIVAYHQVPFQKGYTSLQFHQHIITAAVPVLQCFFAGRQVLLGIGSVRVQACDCVHVYVRAYVRVCVCWGVEGKSYPVPNVFSFREKSPRAPHSDVSGLLPSPARPHPQPAAHNLGSDLSRAPPPPPAAPRGPGLWLLPHRLQSPHTWKHPKCPVGDGRLEGVSTRTRWDIVQPLERGDPATRRRGWAWRALCCAKGRQVLCDLIHAWNLKTPPNSQKKRSDVWVAEAGVGGGELEESDQKVRTSSYEISDSWDVMDGTVTTRLTAVWATGRLFRG